MFFCVLVLTAASGCVPKQKSVSDRIIELVESNAQNEGKYWFRMKNRINGNWNPVILVFGYVDNKAVCEKLIEAGKEDAPDVSFDCNEA